MKIINSSLQKNKENYTNVKAKKRLNMTHRIGGMGNVVFMTKGGEGV